jgi:hypothetical protein
VFESEKKRLLHQRFSNILVVYYLQTDIEDRFVIELINLELGIVVAFPASLDEFKRTL